MAAVLMLILQKILFTYPASFSVSANVDTWYDNSLHFLHMLLFLLQIPTATAACSYKIFTLYSHTSGIWDYLLRTVNKNMAYILSQSFWLSLCDMISVESHKDCQVMLNARGKKEKRMCCHDCVERWCHSKFSGERCKLLWLGLLSKEACLHQNSSNFSHLVCRHCATSQQTLTQSRCKLWRKTSAEQKHLELKQMAFPCISRGYLVNTSFEAQLTNKRALHCSCPIPLCGSLNITPESLFKRHRLIRARHTILNTL